MTSAIDWALKANYLFIYLSIVPKSTECYWDVNLILYLSICLSIYLSIVHLSMIDRSIHPSIHLSNSIKSEVGCARCVADADVASRAMLLVNGFTLNGKPVIVQYGKRTAA